MKEIFIDHSIIRDKDDVKILKKKINQKMTQTTDDQKD